jgi:hypothetical protein
LADFLPEDPATSTTDQDGIETLLAELVRLGDSRGPEALADLQRALPWLRVALEARADEHADYEETLRRLHETGAIKRVPDSTARDFLSDGRLLDLAGLERQLQQLDGAPKEEVTARLLDDGTLLGTALELVASSDGPLAKRLRELLALSDIDVASASRRAQALRALETLEAGDLPEAFDVLEKRSRKFEGSLAKNMARHGLRPAVAAALAFGTGQRDDEAQSEAVYAFERFRDDAPLAKLARALMAMRGRCVEHLSGRATMRHLEPWVEYLRGACQEFAEDREISETEAVSFAHFCLHLMNMCDLAADAQVTEPAREALRSVEDAVKEFAVASDRPSRGSDEGLATFERGQWMTRDPAAYLGHRLAGLQGGWTRGFNKGAVGAPATFDTQTEAKARAAWEAVSDEIGRKPLESLSNMLAKARMEGAGWVQKLEPVDAAKILMLGMVEARDVPRIDPEEPWVLDLTPLEEWCEANDGPSIRVLAAYLERREPGEILEGQRSPEDLGVVATQKETSPALKLEFKADDELEALLTLLDSSRASSGAFWRAVETRLDEMISSESRPRSSVPSGL